MVTYSITHRNVIGNRRFHVGQVVIASGYEGLNTLYIDPGLRIVNNFQIASLTSGCEVTVVYPTSFPELGQQSGYITILTVSISGETLLWTATGKA